jgi:hypothetical protein
MLIKVNAVNSTLDYLSAPTLMSPGQGRIGIAGTTKKFITNRKSKSGCPDVNRKG